MEEQKKLEREHDERLAREVAEHEARMAELADVAAHRTRQETRAVALEELCRAEFEYSQRCRERQMKDDVERWELVRREAEAMERIAVLLEGIEP